jgi:nicotinamidase-related amidase
MAANCMAVLNRNSPGRIPSQTLYDKGYGVTVITDATAANSEEEQNYSEQKIFPLLGQTLSVDQFISQLEE